MSDIVEHLVEFSVYCPKCKYKNLPEEEEPCRECLCHPVMEHSRKPYEFKPKND